MRRAVLAAASARYGEPDVFVRIGLVRVVRQGRVLLGRRWDAGDRGEVPGGGGGSRALLLRRRGCGDALHRYVGRLLQAHRERHLGSRERLRGLHREVLRSDRLFRSLPFGGGLLLELGEVRVALLLGEPTGLLRLWVIRRVQHRARVADDTPVRAPLRS